MVDFELTDLHLKKALSLNGGYYCLPCELPTRRVSVAVYQSGERLVKRVSARGFRGALLTFCSQSSEAVRKGEDSSGWSHHYDQPPGEGRD